MKILLTGSTGFIGKHFLAAYQTAYEIDCFSFLHDTLESLDLHGTDAILHLSALVHQMQGAPDDAYRRVNVDNTIALAKKAKEAGVPHFIFMSSIKVYGEESDQAYDETTPCLPTDPYGQSKLDAENALLELAGENFTVSIIRTPVVYGEGVKGNIRSLLKLVERVPVLPFGGIENQRSMVYVGNLCALIDAIIKDPKGGLFLAADPAPVSTTLLIEEIAHALKKKPLLLKLPLFGWFLKKLKPALHARLFGSLRLDTHKSNTRLGFTPPFSTREGVEAMVRWYKDVA